MKYLSFLLLLSLVSQRSFAANSTCDPSKNHALKSLVLEQVKNLKKGTKSPAYPQRRYIDNEVKPVASVFSKPGVSWRTCSAGEKDLCIGWPDSQSHVWQVGDEVKVEMDDPYSDQKEVNSFTPVVYCYTRQFKSVTGETKELTQINFGYINSGQLSEKKLKAIFGSEDPTTTNLAKTLGKCVVPPRTQIPGKPQNPHAAFVVPHLVDKNGKLKPDIEKAVRGVKKADGTPLTGADVVTIDAVARTLVAEMGRCFSRGIQYPMAVARIIYNRSLQSKGSTGHRRLYEVPTEGLNPAVESLARVATKPSQFNNWLIHAGSERGLRRSLCPPTEVGKPFFNGERASANDVKIWETAVRIATDMVVNEKHFLNVTNEVVYSHYTSCINIPWKGTNEVVGVRVEGRELSDPQCIRLAYDPKSRVPGGEQMAGAHRLLPITNNRFQCPWEKKFKETNKTHIRMNSRRGNR